jgi:hypothetical protein
VYFGGKGSCCFGEKGVGEVGASKGLSRRQTPEVSSGEGFPCEERRSKADWSAWWSAGLRRFIGEWPLVDVRLKVFSKLSWMP